MARGRDVAPLRASLLDRLTDERPSASREAGEKIFVSADEYRAAVIRDIGWLLNTVHLGDEEELAAHPQVARSVLNFGVPELTGRTLSSVDARALEKTLQQAIVAFEPRIIAESLRVRVRSQQDLQGPNSLVFRIEGQLRADPRPLHLSLRTEVDLESGNFSVAESGERG